MRINRNSPQLVRQKRSTLRVYPQVQASWLKTNSILGRGWSRGADLSGHVLQIQLFRHVNGLERG
jgi:hypothetical protein